MTPAAARDLLRRRVGPELQRAGVQAEQRDPVREHVVHLARDPGALRAARLLDPQLLLGLGALGALAQRAAPAGAGRGRTCPRRRRPRSGARRSATSTQKAVVRRVGRSSRRHAATTAPATGHATRRARRCTATREQRDQRGDRPPAPRTRRHGAMASADADRPAPAHTTARTQAATPRDEVERAGAPRVRPRSPRRRRSADARRADGEQERDDVDEPVARRPARRRRAVASASARAAPRAASRGARDRRRAHEPRYGRARRATTTEVDRRPSTLVGGTTRRPTPRRPPRRPC